MVELAIETDETVEWRAISRRIARPAPDEIAPRWVVPTSGARATEMGRRGAPHPGPTDLASRYFQARLPEHLDESVWIDEAAAVNPLGLEAREAAPETFPIRLRCPSP